MRLDWTKRFGIYGAVTLLGVVAGTLAGPGTAHAATTTESVNCIENSAAFISKQFTFDVDAPASATAGSAFTVTLNPTTTTLSSTAADHSTAVTGYQDILLQLQVQNGSFVDGSLNNLQSATDNASAVTETGDSSGNTASFAIAGPIPPGSLATSKWTVGILPADGADSVSLIAVGWNATANTAGGGLSDTCSLPSNQLMSVDVTAATTTTTAVTTTTTLPTTTTTSGPGTTVPKAVQKTITGSSSVSNNCTATLDPPIQKPAPTPITVGLSTTAFPQPHEGDPITLSNTKLSLAVPATLLQLGVDAGLIKNGDKVPSNVDLVVAGSHTTQGTHDYKVSGVATIAVVGGKAQPLHSTLALPNTTWTPSNASDPVFFTEKSMGIVSTLNLPILGTVTVTFVCDPGSSPASFVALSAQGSAPPAATGGGSTGATVGAVAGSGATVAAAATSAELPRTGSNSWPLVFVGLGSIELGALAVQAAKRFRRPVRA